MLIIKNINAAPNLIVPCLKWLSYNLKESVFYRILDFIIVPFFVNRFVLAWYP